MLCKYIYNTRLSTAGRILARVELVADIAPEAFPDDGKGIDGLADEILIDDSSRLTILETGDTYIRAGGTWHKAANSGANGILQITGNGIYDVSDKAIADVKTAEGDPYLWEIGTGGNFQKDNYSGGYQVVLGMQLPPGGSGAISLRTPEAGQWRYEITLYGSSWVGTGYHSEDGEEFRLSRLQYLYDLYADPDKQYDVHKNKGTTTMTYKSSPTKQISGIVSIFRANPKNSASTRVMLSVHRDGGLDLAGAPKSYYMNIGAISLEGAYPT